MKKTYVTRRGMLEAGFSALTAATISPINSAYAQTALTSQSEETVRKYYAAWEQNDWQPMDVLLSDNFTFTSANNDDHISKNAFKSRCWESQKDFIKRFDLQRIYGSGNEALVMYVGRTKNDKTFRNVEFLKLKDGKVEAIECYFGAKSSFPSAASASQG